MKRVNRVISRILNHPGVLKARLKGIHFNHSQSCYIARDLLKTPPRTIIDVGANNGEFTNACKYVFPDSKIYAFEPLKEQFEIVKRIPGVEIFNFGLWNKNGQSTFFRSINSGGLASSFLEPNENSQKISGKFIKEIAIQKRFDKLNLKFERPCFLKIDVEGAEEKVLQGFGKQLKEVDIIQVECFFKSLNKNQMKLSSLFKLLERFGFTGFLQIEVGYADNKPDVCDLIFFKE